MAVLSLIASDASADETVKIGGIYSLSGPAAPFGVPERDIVEALTAKVNAEGGINGKKVELVICDDQTNPTEAARCATRLIRQERVVAITGPTTGSGTLAAMPIAMNNKVPVLAPVGTITVTSKDNAFWPWIFRTAPSDTLIIDAVMERGVFRPGHKRIAIMYQEDAYGEAGMKQGKKLAEEHGVEVVAAVGAPLNAIDLTAAATNIRNSNPDVVLLKTSAPPLGAAFVRAAKQVGIEAPIIGTGSLNQRPFIDAVGPAGEGIQIVSIGNWDDPSDRQKTLGEVIIAAGKTPKGYAELIGSTGILAAFEAVRRVEGEVTGESVRAALETICDFRDTYLDGNLCYSPDQHEGVFQDTLITVEIHEGKFRTMK
ncbi:MAG TPA: ABC transporter substrate-binding protein [Rhizobiaceae bacterium]|nr:ABC transporter substrate-binding protein [Rhizobiaceae bacterium]